MAGALTRRRTLRIVMFALAAGDAAVGVYAITAPRSFYDHVVGVDLLGPYNEHLLTDVGGFYLGFALLFTWAGCTLHRELVRAASAAAALTAALHLGFHTAHLTGFTTGQTVLQTTGLVVALALPSVTYVMAGPHPSPKTREATARVNR